jgi:hypothetical protein
MVRVGTCGKTELVGELGLVVDRSGDDAERRAVAARKLVCRPGGNDQARVDEGRDGVAGERLDRRPRPGDGIGRYAAREAAEVPDAVGDPRQSSVSR